jgi:hypothetical protein
MRKGGMAEEWNDGETTPPLQIVFPLFHYSIIPRWGKTHVSD